MKDLCTGCGACVLACPTKAISKQAGFDLTGMFYNVAGGKLRPSKQGFAAYMNIALTNAVFQYFGNIGSKAPVSYIGGPSKGRLKTLSAKSSY